MTLKGYKSWNARCAECHVIGCAKIYDARARTYSSVQNEIGVGCEACHGPGEAHVAWAKAPDTYNPRRATSRTDHSPERGEEVTTAMTESSVPSGMADSVTVGRLVAKIPNSRTLPRYLQPLSADDKPRAGHGNWDTRNPVTCIVGRRQRFSGHPTEKALPSTQAPSPPSAEFKSLTAFLKRSICPASISVLPWATSRLSIMASSSSASSLGTGTAVTVASGTDCDPTARHVPSNCFSSQAIWRSLRLSLTAHRSS